MEKAVSIGSYVVAAGLQTQVGVMLPVLGSRIVAEVLTEKTKELTGGYFMVELDPKTTLLLNVIVAYHIFILGI